MGFSIINHPDIGDPISPQKNTHSNEIRSPSCQVEGAAEEFTSQADDCLLGLPLEISQTWEFNHHNSGQRPSEIGLHLG